MNLHEYQSKEVFAAYGIPVPTGRVASTPEEAVAAAAAVLSISNLDATTPTAFRAGSCR